MGFLHLPLPSLLSLCIYQGEEAEFLKELLTGEEKEKCPRLSKRGKERKEQK